MKRKSKIRERIRRERQVRRTGIIGIILIFVVLLILIGIAIWDKAHEESEVERPVMPQTKDEIICNKFSSFSGQYVEDGKDTLVENVAAILVTNQSKRFLDLATLEYEIDGKKATFVVTGLPAGKSAWVLEENKMTVTEQSKYKYIDRTTSFKDGVVDKTDKISLSAEGNMLTAVNNTDEKLEGVFVYYKTLHTDGNFLGGITYMVEFGVLEPGAKTPKIAGHYEKGKTEIVRIGWR